MYATHHMAVAHVEDAQEGVAGRVARLDVVAREGLVVQLVRHNGLQEVLQCVSAHDTSLSHTVVGFA